MKKDNIVQNKSYVFAVKIVKTCTAIMKEHNEYILSKQLIRSDTSIGANIEEAIGGQSRKDFFAKLLSHIKKQENHIIGLDYYMIQDI